MSSVNKAILMGNVGADPELRYTPSGQAVCDVRMATNEKWTDKAGQKQERTEWHRLVIWGKAAETIKKYVTKGDSLYVEGRIQSRSWDDEKTNTKRYMTEIVVNEFQLIGGRKDKAGAEGESSGRGDGPPADGGGSSGGGGERGNSKPPASDDDIPF